MLLICNMPRPPTHRHVLRDLRNAIPRTQAQFAKLLGVSRVYINKIENGQTQISPSLANRVGALTGISTGELVKGSEGKLIDLIGKPYGPETFIWWQKTVRQPPSKADVISCVRNFRWWAWILLRAAAVHYKGVGYATTVVALNQSLNTIRHEFGLEETTNRILREYSPSAKWLPGGRTAPELLRIDRELQKELAQAEAEAQYNAERRRRVYWQAPKPTKKQPSKKRRR